MKHGHHTRRQQYDPLQPSVDPTWLVVRDKLACVLAVTPLEPGTDLRAILTAAREARLAAGWDCEEIGPACASFFCSRDGTRELVVIERRKPPAVGARS